MKMKNSIIILLFILIMVGCTKKIIVIPPKKTTHQEAEQAVKEAQEELEITKGAIESEKDNIEVGVDTAQQEAELEQAKDLMEAGKYKKAVEVAEKAQEEVYRTKSELLAMVIEKRDSETNLMPGQPGYEEDHLIQGETVTYIVGTWEHDRACLWNIAKEILGDPWKWKRIYKANKGQIEDPDLIFHNQILIIPIS